MNIYNYFVNRISTAFEFSPRKQPSSPPVIDIAVEIDRVRFEAVMTKRGIPPHLIEKLFSSIDINGDGKISGIDFQRLLQRYSSTIKKDETAAAGTAKQTVNETTNTVPTQTAQKQKTEKPAMNSETINDRIANLEKQASTYTKNGTPRMYATSMYINALA